MERDTKVPAAVPEQFAEIVSRLLLPGEQVLWSARAGRSRRDRRIIGGCLAAVALALLVSVVTRTPVIIPVAFFAAFIAGVLPDWVLHRPLYLLSSHRAMVLRRRFGGYRIERFTGEMLRGCEIGGREIVFAVVRPSKGPAQPKGFLGIDGAASVGGMAREVGRRSLSAPDRVISHAMSAEPGFPHLPEARPADIEQLRAYLEPGEVVLWTCRPTFSDHTRGNRANKAFGAGLFVLILGLPFGMASIWGRPDPSHPRTSMIMFIVLFALATPIGVTILWRVYRQWPSALFAITSRRSMLVQPGLWSGAGLSSHWHSGEEAVTVRVRRDGRGDLTFGLDPRASRINHDEFLGCAGMIDVFRTLELAARRDLG